MLKRVCYVGWLPILIIFSLSFLDGLEYLKETLGHSETAFLLIVAILFVLTLFFLRHANECSNKVIGASIIFFSITFLIIGYSAFPERIYERAQDRSGGLIDYEVTIKDKNYTDRINYAKTEQRARRLELEAAELRHFGPKDFYGFYTWQYVFFLLSIGLLTAYGLCWFFLK